MKPGRAGSLSRWKARMTTRETAKMVARSLRTITCSTVPARFLGVLGKFGESPERRLAPARDGAHCRAVPPTVEKSSKECKVVVPSMSTPRFRLLRPEDDPRDAQLSRTEATLRATARQQEAVAHLGQQTLAGAPVADLMDTAVALATRTLDADFGSVLELRPESRTLLLRAGVGWRDGSVGCTILPAEPGTHAGYTLRAPGPVVGEGLAAGTGVWGG